MYSHSINATVLASTWLKEPNRQLVTVSVGFMLSGLLFFHVCSLIQHMGVYKSISLKSFSASCFCRS